MKQEIDRLSKGIQASLCPNKLEGEVINTMNYLYDGIITASIAPSIIFKQPEVIPPKPPTIDELIVAAQSRLRVALEANVQYERIRIIKSFTEQSYLDTCRFNYLEYKLLGKGRFLSCIAKRHKPSYKTINGVPYIVTQV